MRVLATVWGGADGAWRDASPTRFVTWRPLPARALLAALLLLLAVGLAVQFGSGTTVRTTGDPERTDAALYRAVAGRVAGGENYYAAAVAEHRGRGYPLRPFLTVRLPTLAEFAALTGPSGAAVALRGLSFLALAAVLFRLRQAVGGGPVRIAAATLAAAGIVVLGTPAFAVWHEAWSVLLVCLSLACRSERHWAASVALGLLAVLVRELALPYLCVMAVLAWQEGRSREALAWAGAILLFAAGLAAHAACLATYVAASDAASPGWSAGGGWAFVLGMVQNCTLLAVLPAPAVAYLVPLALFGWIAWRSPVASRGAFLLLGYAAAFMIVGRAENFYWGLMLAPLLLIGLAFAPSGLRDLWRVAFRPQPA